MMDTLERDTPSEKFVWDLWRRRALASPEREAIVHLELEREPYRWSWGRLVRAAAHVARALAAQGVRRGDVCALIVRHHRNFYPVYMAVCSLGAIPAVLAYPNARLHPDKFRDGLKGMAEHSGLDLVLTEHELDALVAPLVGGPRSTIRAVLHPLDALEGDWRWDGPLPEHPPGDGSEPCLLQHSSGTTGLQKPVVLSHRAVLTHVARYARAIALTEGDKIVSWLPLYHDMGLIAAWYLPLVAGVPLVQLSPMEWVAAPGSLLQALSAERGTLCWLPNFAYNFMADRVRDDDLEGVRLDGVRLLVNCSEPVRAESHARLLERFGPLGLPPSALGACYAMAETTFAVSQTRPGRPARQLVLDRAELARGNVVPLPEGAPGRISVSSGVPIEGCRVRIVDEQRHDLPPGKVGEIAIASETRFDGYRNFPEKTAAVLIDGWYHSGDLGFVHEGECYVVGRKKDLIIVAGNNIQPEDVEDAVSRVPGVLPGRVVAFGADNEALGTEELCVIAETDREDAAARKALRREILKAGMAVDVTIARVFLVPPRWMIKSSSGKPARAANKQRALTEPLPG